MPDEARTVRLPRRGIIALAAFAVLMIALLGMNVLGIARQERLLNRQREYYSERAITEVEAALARAIAQLEQLCHHDNADKVVSDLLRKLDVVTNLSAWSDPKNAH